MAVRGVGLESTDKCPTIKSRDEGNNFSLNFKSNLGVGGVLLNKGNYIYSVNMSKKYNVFSSVDTSKVESITKKVSNPNWREDLSKIDKKFRKKFKKHNKKGFSNKARINKQRKTIRSYKTYMKSKLWVKRKNRYWQEHGRYCVACGGTYMVTLHHAYYSGIYGNEPDTEVFAFCRGCHKRFHEIYKLQKDMREDTNKFIDEVQEEIFNNQGFI